MGRHKQYLTSADRQAAYRQRLHTETVIVDRRQFDRLLLLLEHLHAALAQAKRAGDPCAGHVYHVGVESTLEALTAWFRTRTPGDGVP
jgi:hypothetical protein